ncbi:MAG: hypothetical protein COV45_08490 [Deltaproteobacteria bacterium CG11_big_fil_rev_8_21_14_0_20_47_16]|nr:MAG: hypothetical protein COV45_08490 [Deltaproteobacteria bacterium CG11_big_fil_rev_8_21_14_0_20_47_16]
MCIKFEGRVFKQGRYWPIDVPALNVHTQGKSRKDALFMIKDALEMIIDRKGFSVAVSLLPQNRVIVQTKNAADDKYLIARMLQGQRAKCGLSIQQVADRLGVSKHAYAQYEQARAIPSIAKIVEFISAMNKHAHVAIDLLNDAEAA